jgi:hypothetical protein
VAPDEADNFLWFGKAPGCLLGKNQAAIGNDLVDAR